MSYNSIYDIIGLNNEVNRLETQAKLGWSKEFRALKWLGLKDGMKILDVGSGPGSYTELLLENLPNSEITGLEIDKNLLFMALDKLSDREKQIMELRFGLTTRGNEKTQKEVASILGISQSYISRLEKKIINRLKKEINKMI